MDYQELKQVPIFASCGEAELERLLESPHKVSTFKPGETMVRFGTPCRSLLLLTEGTAISDATLWQINREAFLAFMQRNPQVLRAFLKLISDRAQFLSGKVRAFAIKGLRNRTLDYMVLHGGISNVAQAAEVLGVARPSLSRVLSELVDEGVIKKGVKGYGL